MIIYTLALRYAKSIFELGIEEKDLNLYRQQLIFIDELFKKSADFKQVVINPRISASNKIALIIKILDKQDLNKNIVNFLKLLALKNRFIIFTEILQIFDELYHQHNNSLVIDITTVAGLKKEDKDQLKEKLATAFQCKIELTEITNPDILGGIVARVKSLLIDGSLKNFLLKMRNNPVKI